MDEIYCLECKDYRARRVVFTKTQRMMKARKRPELLDEGIVERIRRALEQPTCVYDDFEHRDRLVYYRDEYTVNGITRYMKVVVRDQGDMLCVITAFRPDYVKEWGKTLLRYGTDTH